jgi:hypothetical protein
MNGFNYILGDEKIATLQIPEGLEVTATEKIGIIGYGLQKAIIEGKTRVTKRVWPCIYCGNRTFGSQPALIKHFEASHLKEEQNIKEWLEKQPKDPTGFTTGGA